MAEDDYLYSEQHSIGPLDPTSSMVVIRESPIFAKDDRLLFPPVNHENLLVASSIYGVDTYLESPSESSSPSSSSRRSGSSSSFSLFPSDSDGQPPLTACEIQEKSPPSSDSDEHSPFTACQTQSPASLSQQAHISLKIPLYRDWWELICSKLKTLFTWFSTTLRSFYPLLAIAIWWWMRVRARRRRVKGETLDHLRDAVKERDERIVQLLHQIAQMNELLLKHHKDMVSRR